MNTGGRLEDLDADQLFNIALADLYRLGGMTAEEKLSRESVTKAIDKITQQNETGLPPELDEWGIGPADEMYPVDGSASPMGSFDDLVEPPL